VPRADEAMTGTDSWLELLANDDVECLLCFLPGRLSAGAASISLNPTTHLQLASTAISLPTFIQQQDKNGNDKN